MIRKDMEMMMMMSSWDARNRDVSDPKNSISFLIVTPGTLEAAVNG
jgi:hypothetical protein